MSRYGLETAAAVAVAAAIATGLAPPAGAASGRPARAGGPATVPVTSAAQPGRASRQLLLINGDRLVVNSAGALTGPGVIGPGGPAAPAGPVMGLSLGGHRYDVPSVALAYLSHGLDPRLFEPGLLLARERNGRLPVRVGYTGHVPVLPGVTLTRSGGGTAFGYLTQTSARLFGGALERQYRADHARASYGTDGMFAGRTTIALAGTPTTRPPSRPDYPMRTLKVNATNLLGKPDTGDEVFVFNVDSTDRVDQDQTFQAFFYHGQARYSVPVGHYMAIGVFGLSVEHIVVLPQFTVTAAASTTVTMRASAASSLVTTVTPRPAVVLGQAITLLRTGRSGGPIGVGWFGSGGGDFYFSPTHTKPAIGTLRMDLSTQLKSPPGQGTPYEYALSYTGPPGTIPVQRYVVHAKDLATIHERFDQPVKSSGLFWFSGVFPLGHLEGISSWYLPLAVPGGLTEYAGGAGTARVAWWGSYSPYVPSGGQPGGGGVQPPALTESPRILRAGEVLSDVWSAYPLHPAANVLFTSERTRLSAPQPSAVRAGNTLGLEADPFDDSTPGHLIGLLQQTSTSAITGSYQIDQNGTKIAGGNAATQVGPNSEFYTRATLSPRPSTIRFSLKLARTDKYFPLSTATSTVWTWHSTPVTGATLPPGWSCAPRTTGRDCAIEPMMTLGYAVAHLGQDGAAPAGPQHVHLTVGHLQAATASKVTKASVAVSFDGGTTWHPATLTGTGGSYTASFPAPAGTQVSLRTTAADAAGGTIAEAITSAYQIAATGLRAGSTAGGAGVRVTGGAPVRVACGAARAGEVRCLAPYAPQVAVNAALAARAAGQRVPASATTPQGWGATDIEAAYKLPASVNPHATVAVVIPFSAPHLAADLRAYRKQYGLPACTTVGGCLRIVNQQGKPSPLPGSGVASGWALEETRDVEMVSAACPRCKILAVEGHSPSFADLAAAENTAARLGAVVISNSYVATENGLDMRYAKAYDHPGHMIVAESGFSGFTAAQYPANLATVTAVGGTKLARAHNARGWRERVWYSAQGASGSGCSAYVAKPPWQHDPHCLMRTVTDVSAVASNLAIYYSSVARGGPWLLLSGTGAAAPIIAGVYGLAGNAATITPGYPYAHHGGLFDVTEGNNDWFNGSHGATCGHDYLCVAKKGYDAPTGLGTPDGTSAF